MQFFGLYNFYKIRSKGLGKKDGRFMNLSASYMCLVIILEMF